MGELVAAMASGGGAAAKSVNKAFLKQLPTLTRLANSVVPTHNKAIARKVMALRTSLAETATASTVTKMLAVIDGIISEMETRLEELARRWRRWRRTSRPTRIRSRTGSRSWWTCRTRRTRP